MINYIISFHSFAIYVCIRNNVQLYPGDIILTGTPDGVGFAMKPPSTLQSGDVVDIEIEHIGRLSNKVR